jgi:hypothetical protein
MGEICRTIMAAGGGAGKENGEENGKQYYYQVFGFRTLGLFSTG